MAYRTGELIRNVVVPFLTAKVKKASVSLQTLAANDAGAVVELVGSMDGQVWTRVALLDPADGVTLYSVLTGPNQFGVTGENTASFSYYGVRRTDAGGGSCRVLLGIKD